jgi:arylsulfatase A-like enzyme
MKDAEGQEPLPAREVTLAERLRERGYATAVIGKWGLGGPGTEGHPLSQGFDFFYGYLCQRVAHNHYPAQLWRDRTAETLAGNQPFSAHQRLSTPPADPSGWERFSGTTYAPARCLEEALAFMRRSKDRPYFLYFASTLPHLALQVPPEYVDRYPGEWDPAPYLGDRGYLPHLRPHAAYAGMISCLDDQVGRLLEEVKKLGQDERTVILITSDNGASFTGGMDRRFFDSQGGLRGHKSNLYEGGLRVPLIARAPGLIPAGRVTEATAWGPDLFPTVLDLAGVEPTAPDGRSLVPELLGHAAPAPPPCLYWEHPEGVQQQAVILDGRWKAIRPNLREQPDRVELYDLGADPAEAHDLSASQAAILSRARAAMTAARSPHPQFPIPALDEAARSK